jgi:ubiquinone/menaquinone biosynthesis C-methylase UbiE
MDVAHIDKNMYELIKTWMSKNRPKVDPSHQIERMAWLRQWVNGRTLSVGCGEAKVEEYVFLKSDGNVNYDTPLEGVDISEEYVLRARNRWKKGNFLCQDVRSKTPLPYQDNIFHTVILSEILEHVEPYYIHRILGECLRVLKPDGQLLITSPSSEYKESLAEMVFSSDHFTMFTDKSLDMILNPSDVMTPLHSEAQFVSNKQWFLNNARAIHNFDYTYCIQITPSKNFYVIRITKGNDYKMPINLSDYHHDKYAFYKKYPDFKDGNYADIAEHLKFMEDTCVSINAKVLLELGVRTGNSTRAFLRAIEKTDGKLTSIDMYDCSWVARDNKRWTFYTMDDLGYVPPAILDVLFIDTEHTYAQAIAEMNHFMRFVRIGGVVFMHDTISCPPVLKAIEQWLKENPDQFKFENRTNNNGLGVLWRIA